MTRLGSRWTRSYGSPSSSDSDLLSRGGRKYVIRIAYESALCCLRAETDRDRVRMEDRA